jgi:predicted metal-dependent hydrolase
MEYLLNRAKRRSISLKIERDGVVRVVAPQNIDKEVVDSFVLSKIDWILEVKRKMNERIKIGGIKNYEELNKEKIQAKRLIFERINVLNSQKIFRYVKITIKDMKSQWGSCSTLKNLNFNYRLKYLPIELIDYVIVHELCHLVEHNHGKNFWLKVGDHIPDYAVRRKKLKKYLLC